MTPCIFFIFANRLLLDLNLILAHKPFFLACQVSRVLDSDTDAGRCAVSHRAADSPRSERDDARAALFPERRSAAHGAAKLLAAREQLRACMHACVCVCARTCACVHVYVGVCMCVCVCASSERGIGGHFYIYNRRACDQKPLEYTREQCARTPVHTGEAHCSTNQTARPGAGHSDTHPRVAISACSQDKQPVTSTNNCTRAVTPDVASPQSRLPRTHGNLQTPRSAIQHPPRSPALLSTTRRLALGRARAPPAQAVVHCACAAAGCEVSGRACCDCVPSAQRTDNLGSTGIHCGNWAWVARALELYLLHISRPKLRCTTAAGWCHAAPSILIAGLWGIS